MDSVRSRLNTWIGLNVWRLPEWYTRLEIANDAGCSKSPSLLKELDLLCVAGKLERIKIRDDHDREVIKYRITDEYRESVYASVKGVEHAR